MVLAAVVGSAVALDEPRRRPTCPRTATLRPILGHDATSTAAHDAASTATHDATSTARDDAEVDGEGVGRLTRAILVPLNDGTDRVVPVVAYALRDILNVATSDTAGECATSADARLRWMLETIDQLDDARERLRSRRRWTRTSAWKRSRTS